MRTPKLVELTLTQGEENPFSGFYQEALGQKKMPGALELLSQVAVEDSANPGAHHRALDRPERYRTNAQHHLPRRLDRRGHAHPERAWAALVREECHG
jgi:hypothetical protein